MKKPGRLCLVFICLLFTVPSLLFLSGCAKKKRTGGLVIWHWMTDREEAFNKLADEYTAMTGMEVRFELYAPSDAYSQKVRAAAQTDTLPDIFGVLGERRDFASFIKSGHIANLSEAMEKDGWKTKFFDKALAMNEFRPGNHWGVKPGIYGVPIDVTNIQMLYNKDLFARAGLDPERPPQTWEEFLEAGKKLKEAGIQGLVSGWGEIWMIDCLASNYAFNIMGKEKIISTLKGKVSYTDPDWIKVFSLFKEMADSGILAKGIVTMVNKTAEQMFANARAAMAFNGSWGVNVYRGMNPALNYASFLPPRVSDKFPLLIWGGAGSSFMVNEKSQKKRAAIEFLRWFTAEKQQSFLAQATFNMPANRHSITEVPPALDSFADDMDRVIHPSLLPASEFPVVIEAFDKGIQSIIIGEKSPEQVALEIQKLKNKEIRKQTAKK